MTSQGCHAYQQNDQMCCPRCGYTWDMDDTQPPECLAEKQVAKRIGQAGLERLHEIVDD